MPNYTKEQLKTQQTAGLEQTPFLKFTDPAKQKSGEVFCPSYMVKFLEEPREVKSKFKDDEGNDRIQPWVQVELVETEDTTTPLGFYTIAVSNKVLTSKFRHAIQDKRQLAGKTFNIVKLPKPEGKKYFDWVFEERVE